MQPTQTELEGLRILLRAHDHLWNDKDARYWRERFAASQFIWDHVIRLVRKTAATKIAQAIVMKVTDDLKHGGGAA
jgi:hypothetical protein